ncbi:hypothetical protein AK812_SmicGene44858, partial [Symbiodinium microadriaticum]
MSAQSVPVPDTTSRRSLTSVEDQLLAPHLQQVVLQRARTRTLLCQKNTLLRPHLELVACPLVVWQQVEADAAEPACCNNAAEMDLEEERRNKAEEKVAKTAEAAKKAAEAALTRDPFDPRAAAFSAEPVDKGPVGGLGGSNRAEKYLPPLPLIDHHVMGK